jgi:hypothetical protein
MLGDERRPETIGMHRRRRSSELSQQTEKGERPDGAGPQASEDLAQARAVFAEKAVPQVSG